MANYVSVIEKEARKAALEGGDVVIVEGICCKCILELELSRFQCTHWGACDNGLRFVTAMVFVWL